MIKPYTPAHQFKIDGITFTMTAEAKVFASVAGKPPEQVVHLSSSDGKPWMMSPRSLKRTCKDLMQDGELDHLVRHLERYAEFRRRRGFLHQRMFELTLKIASTSMYELSGVKHEANTIINKVTKGIKADELALFLSMDAERHKRKRTRK